MVNTNTHPAPLTNPADLSAELLFCYERALAGRANAMRGAAARAATCHGLDFVWESCITAAQTCRDAMFAALAGDEQRSCDLIALGSHQMHSSTATFETADLGDDYYYDAHGGL
jgi:hypothetical protein